tara:strand:+ start:166 stop:531 length:366 start_codon:yes stop_codon:yes gene_type:complete
MSNEYNRRADMTERHNKIYYLGSRRGYWTGVLDLVGSMKSELENAENKEFTTTIKATLEETEKVINNILIFSYVLDKAKDIYPDADLFGKIPVEEKLKILTDICVKEIEFANEEFRDEHVA